MPTDGRRRWVAAAIFVAVALLIGAAILMPAAFGFDTAAIAYPGSIVDKGEATAQLLRWGALVDMLSYLPFAVVVVYFHYQLRTHNPELVALLTACGLAYVLIGSMAGALLASAGPPLIAGYASASAEGREAARVALEALAHISVVGWWGTLELIFLGVWFLGIGGLLRRTWRAFARLSIVVGVAVLVASARTGLTGRAVVEIEGPIDILVAAPLGLFVVWQVWLAGRLWRGT
jgi:hypothetical protein